MEGLDKRGGGRRKRSMAEAGEGRMRPEEGGEGRRTTEKDRKKLVGQRRMDETGGLWKRK